MDITLTTKIQAPGMTTIEETTVISVEARDFISISVPAATADMEVEIAPGTLPQTHLVYIMSSAYDVALPPKYRVNLVSNPEVVLSAPALFVEGQDEMAPGPFDKLFLSNPSASDIVVSILVGRDATP